MPPLAHMSRRTNTDASANEPAGTTRPEETERPGSDADGRGVVLLRNGTTAEREAAVVLSGPETVVRHATLAPGEVAVVGSPVTGGPVTVEVHADDASASFTFDPDEAPVPPLFTLREGRVLVAFE